MKFGRLLHAYNAGRREARLGLACRTHREHGSSFPLWSQYKQGWRDERARMAATGQLPQGDLFHSGVTP